MRQSCLRNLSGLNICISPYYINLRHGWIFPSSLRKNARDGVLLFRCWTLFRQLQVTFLILVYIACFLERKNKYCISLINQPILKLFRRFCTGCKRKEKKCVNWHAMKNACWIRRFLERELSSVVPRHRHTKSWGRTKSLCSSNLQIKIMSLFQDGTWTKLLRLLEIIRR